MRCRADRLPSFLSMAPLVLFVVLAGPTSDTAVAEQAVVKVTGVPHALVLAREDLAKMPRQPLKSDPLAGSARS